MTDKERAVEQRDTSEKSRHKEQGSKVDALWNKKIISCIVVVLLIVSSFVLLII